MTTTLKKWGNSTAVRIPARVLEAGRFNVDDVVEVREDAGRIIIEPARKRYSLDDLLKQITPENQPPLIDWGPPVGEEFW
jgi:antitoxin MazE